MTSTKANSIFLWFTISVKQDIFVSEYCTFYYILLNQIFCLNKKYFFYPCLENIPVIIYTTLVKFVDVVVDDLKDALIIGGLKNVSLVKSVVSQLLLHLEHVKFMLVGFMFCSFILASLARTLVDISDYILIVFR